MLSNMKIKRNSYHLCYYHILIFSISHLWRGSDGELLQGYSINVSSHVTVQLGLCVYIPCRFTVPMSVTLTRNALGIWYNTKSRYIVVSKRNNHQQLINGRFFLTGDIWRGDCSLYIEDPIYADTGNYYFRVEDNIKFSYGDILPFVEVTDLKSKPEISPMRSWLDGEKVTLSCTSPGTCIGTAPKLTWHGNVGNGRELKQVQNHANGTKTHFSILTFTARKYYNNSTLTCTLQPNRGLTTAQQITIKVEYPPRAPEIKCSIINKEPSILSSRNCTIDANNIIYPLEGSQLFLTCSADSVPESFLVWKFSNKSQISSSLDKLIIPNLSFTDEGFYTCQATNVHETNETSVTIKMISHPKPKAFPIAAILAGCFAAVLLIAIGVLLIIFYRKYRRKMTQNKEESKQTYVNVTDPIYGNSEMFSIGLHDVGQIPQTDHQSLPEAGSDNQNCQDMQYMRVDFSKLKPNVPADAEEVEYSEIKHKS